MLLLLNRLKNSQRENGISTRRTSQNKQQNEQTEVQKKKKWKNKITDGSNETIQCHVLW